MKLTHEQRHSSTWLAIREHALERLAELRARLEGDLPEKETIQARSSIKELKRLLDLELPDQQEIEANDE